jgi:TetR/AcrR family transcriptional regulator, cholesterol catabolism regulator
MNLSIDQLGGRPPMHDRVTQVAVGLFSNKGFAATGIRDIGRELGLTSATLYHYVANKEELLVGVMEACLHEYLRGGSDAVSSSPDAVVQLCRLVHFHVAAECTNPMTSQVTNREVRSLTGANRARIIDLRDQFDSLYRGVIDAGTEQGTFDLIDPRVSRLVLVEMCNGVANWYRVDGGLSVVKLQDRYASLARRVVGVSSRKRVSMLADLTPARLASEPLATDV